MTTIALTLLMLIAPSLEADKFDDLRKETNLKKRSEKALDMAAESIKTARDVTANFGARSDLEAAITDVVTACQISLEALRETGSPPRRLSKEYKRGELRTREFLRQFEDLIQALSVTDREAVEQARDRVTLIHEEFLLGVMGQKKK